MRIVSETKVKLLLGGPTPLPGGSYPLNGVGEDVH